MTDSKKNDKWVGFDLGGTKMLSTVFDSDFKPLGSKRKKTRGHEGSKTGLKRIVQLIDSALSDADVDRDELRGIGLGCPGPLDLDQGIIIDAPNLGWSNVAVRKTLEDEFDCPAVILNDVDAGVYAENLFGAAKSSRCVLGVFPGTGIGGGCVYQGEIIRGRKSTCMEIGHIQVISDGPRCGCGLYGCLEAVASRLAISAAAAAAAYRGQAPHLREMVGTDLSKIRSGTLASAIEAGDEVIEQILRNAAGHIGVAVADVVHLLAPDTVVLGGGLVEAMPKIFVETVSETANNHLMPAYQDTFKVLAAELGDDASVKGAAAWAEHSLTQKALDT